MKTIKLAITATAIAIATIATAIEKPKFFVIPVNTEKAIIAIQNANNTNFELTIETVNGDLVFRKKSNKPISDYSQVYDFKKLDLGHYVLNLKVNDTRMSNNFEVTKNGIIVGEEIINHGPYFEFINNELIITYLNHEQENMNLYFYNNDRLIYESNLGNDFTQTKGYDLSKLKSGTYRVVLGTHNYQYSYNLKK